MSKETPLFLFPQIHTSERMSKETPLFLFPQIGMFVKVVADYSVEVAVVHSVVHVAILVIVLPPGLDGEEVSIGLQLPVGIFGSLIG